MSDVTYSSTKSVIWAHVKDLRKQLAKAERAAATQPVVVEEPTTVAAADPVGIRHDLRATVAEAMTVFQAEEGVEEELRAELHSVHGVAYSGSALGDLCAQYSDLVDANAAEALSISRTNEEQIATTKITNEQAVRDSRAVSAETIRVANLQYARETTDLKEAAVLAQEQRVELVENVRFAGIEEAELIRSSARAEWDTELSEIGAEEKRTGRIIGAADCVPAAILRAENAGKAQGLAIAQKQLRSESSVVEAQRAQERAALNEDIEQLVASIEVASVRTDSLQQRIDQTKAAAVELAAKSVTSRSDSGALAAVQEIALQQATTPSKR